MGHFVEGAPACPIDLPRETRTARNGLDNGGALDSLSGSYGGAFVEGAPADPISPLLAEAHCNCGLRGDGALFLADFEEALERSASRPETPNYTLYCVVKQFGALVTSAGDRAFDRASRGRH